jgi:integrase
MKNGSAKPVRGVFEHPPNSEIWWINYYTDKRHREKVGRKSDAIELYRKRKADYRAGVKIPDLRRQKVILFSKLIDDAIEFAKAHNSDFKKYISRGEIVRRKLGPLPVDEITPQVISRWLAAHCDSPATSNRYKSLISLCFREGIANGKAKSNPARMVRQKKENNGRLRFLSRDEAVILATAMAEVCPDKTSAFHVSVNTGMRLSEQFTLQWKYLNFERKIVDLTKTKNGVPRIVPLNSIALAAFIEQKKGITPSGNDLIFPNTAGNRYYDTDPWFSAAVEKAGLHNYTWHCNRHTFCSWLAMAGVGLKTIQELAGHKTIAMTARYSHLSPDYKTSEIERMVSGNVTPISDRGPKFQDRTAIKTATKRRG